MSPSRPGCKADRRLAPVRYGARSVSGYIVWTAACPTRCTSSTGRANTMWTRSSTRTGLLGWEMVKESGRAFNRNGGLPGAIYRTGSGHMRLRSNTAQATCGSGHMHDRSYFLAYDLPGRRRDTSFPMQPGAFLGRKSTGKGYCKELLKSQASQEIRNYAARMSARLDSSAEVAVPAML